MAALLKSRCLMLPLLHLWILVAPLSSPGTQLSAPPHVHEVSLPVPDLPLPSFASEAEELQAVYCVSGVGCVFPKSSHALESCWLCAAFEELCMVRE